MDGGDHRAGETAQRFVDTVNVGIHFLPVGGKNAGHVSVIDGIADIRVLRVGGSGGAVHYDGQPLSQKTVCRTQTEGLLYEFGFCVGISNGIVLVQRLQAELQLLVLVGHKYVIVQIIAESHQITPGLTAVQRNPQPMGICARAFLLLGHADASGGIGRNMPIAHFREQLKGGGCGGTVCQSHDDVDYGHGQNAAYGGGADVLDGGGQITQFFSKSENGQLGIVLPVSGVTTQYDFLTGHPTLTSSADSRKNYA